MSQRFPCPNPVCMHEFSAEEVARAVAVTCPRCGMVIQLRAASAGSAPVTAPAGVPMARPVAGPMVGPTRTVPMARPVLPAPPPAPAAPPPPVARPPQPTAPSPAVTPPPPEFAPPIVRARYVPRSRDWLTYSLVIGGFLLLCTLGVVGFLATQRSGLGGRTPEGGYTNSDLNFKFDPRSRAWEENGALKNKIGVSQLVLQRSDPAGFFALDVVDYKDRNPTPRELDDAARTKLREMFPKNVETEPGQGAPLWETDRVAGQQTHRVAFVGDTAEQTFSGEVVFFGNQGLGYWLYTWAPQADAKSLAGEFANLRKNFSLLGKRPAWEQVQQQRRTFDGEKVTGYQLVDTTGRWKKDEDLEAHDPKADLVLRALDPVKPKLAALGADLVVMVLPASKEPIEAAKEHILAKQTREGYPGSKIADAYIEGDGPKERVGEAKGHLLRWRINNGGGRERFALIGLIPRANDLLVVYGECAWERRFNWEAQLLQLVESIQVME